MLSNLRRKIHSNLNEEKTKKKSNSVQKISKSKIKGQKIQSVKTGIKNQSNSGLVFKLRKNFTRKNVTYFVLFLVDIALVIYSARKNIVNYVVVSDQSIFVSKTRYLLFGRNYINLIITSFFYLYICLIHRFFLHEKNTRKFFVCLFFSLIILNCLLFVIFTKRIY